MESMCIGTGRSVYAFDGRTDFSKRAVGEYPRVYHQCVQLFDKSADAQNSLLMCSLFIFILGCGCRGQSGYTRMSGFGNLTCVPTPAVTSGYPPLANNTIALRKGIVIASDVDARRLTTIITSVLV